MVAKAPRGPVILALMFTGVGVALLLNNFLLLEPFQVTALWPLLLVIVGAAVLVRGDFLPDDNARTFGITRGTVESATLEVNAGEIDLFLRDSDKEGRLIVGQYAAEARPVLEVQNTHAQLRLDRAAVRWLTFSDWQLALTPDLPWQLFVSSSIGQADFDLSHLIVEGGLIASGTGDIRLVCPKETLAPLQVRSAVGNIQVRTPLGYKSRIRVMPAPFFNVHVDLRRYVETEPNLYIARDGAPDAPLVDLQVRGTLGDLYLS
ncbi:MAG: LiaI-LiaF-like domain-containing protein [Phototrophicaceae bacterium]